LNWRNKWLQTVVTKTHPTKTVGPIALLVLDVLIKVDIHTVINVVVDLTRRARLKFILKIFVIAKMGL
jgi:hypothetical protein